MRHSCIFRPLLGLFVAMLVAACGGGGGGGTPAPSGLSYPTAPAFVVGQAISSMSPTVTGTVSAYSVSPALPAGLTLSASTGVISGTPTAVTSASSYTVKASNPGGNTTAKITLTVNDARPTIGYGGTNFVFTKQGLVQLIPTNKGGSVVTWSISTALPAGLTFSATDGSIVGTPTAVAAAASYVVTARNSGGQSNVSLTLSVQSVLPSSRFLYVSTSTGGAGGIYAFGVDATTGALSPVSGSPFSSPISGGPIAISGDSKFLYAADGATGKLAAFSIHSDGSLSPVSGSPFATSEPLGILVANPTAGFLYGLGIVSETLMVFAINPASGAPSLVSSVKLLPSYSIVRGVTVTPDGLYLYMGVLLGSGSQIAGFSVDAATGALTPVPGSPLVVNSFGPCCFDAGPVVVDPTGKFLYSVNEYALQVVTRCCVVALKIDAVSGAVTPIPGIPGSSFDVGGGVDSLSASGRFLIAEISTIGPPPTYNNNCVVGVLSIDPATGALTSVPGSPLGPMCGIQDIAADPSGAYVYVGYDSQNGSKIFTWVLDQATGGLNLIGTVTVPALSLGSLALAH
jgi:6-phosphogluconolactonase (cycloisomerase 2 family)